MFEKEIAAYENLLKLYRETVMDRIATKDLKDYNEILFSANSCAIEGNSYSVNDTRELKEKGLGVIPKGKTLFEAFEMLDHFRAYEFLFNQPDAPLTEDLLKETHRILMEHTLSYRYPDALRHIRTERTDEHLICFFFQTAIGRMQREMDEKKKQNIMLPFLF